MKYKYKVMEVSDSQTLDLLNRELMDGWEVHLCTAQQVAGTKESGPYYPLTGVVYFTIRKEDLN